jgi:PAS domain S-box-containing protein
MLRWPRQFFSELESNVAQPLRIRLYRLFCATAAVLCLAVVLPLNLLQHLPPIVNITNTCLGLIATYCLWASKRGRLHFLGFFVALMLLIIPVWFPNGGINGSIGYYFAPILLYPLTIFRGRTRWSMATLVIVVFAALLLADYFLPALTTPFLDPSDRLIDLVTGAICSLLAVTAISWLVLATYDREQKRADDTNRELAASERNYREIFNATNDALIIHDETGRIIDVNERMCAIFGYNRTEALHLSIDDISLGESPFSQKEALANLDRTVREGPQVVAWRNRRRNGEVFAAEVALRASEIGGQRRIIVAIRDISARAAAEQALRLSEERLRQSLAASQQAWFDLDLRSGAGVTSPEYAQLLGLDPADFKATTQGWIDGLHPEDREVVLREFQRCIQTGTTCTLEYRRKAHPEGWRWIRSVAKIVEHDAQGRALRMAGTHTDITERKELEARLLHSQRLEAVGTIASGVAHDLNNILTPMLMASSVLEEKLTDPKDRELMSLLENGAKRGAAIVRQLLTFSSKLTSSRTRVDPRHHVREIVGIMCSTFPPGIKVVEQLAPEVWSVNADPTQLYQVLMNLCVNARDAMPRGGTLTLAVTNTELPSSGISRNPWARGGRFVMITVRDTGHGIPAAIIGRIFDPYFTTKGVGQGTGLGLATVHGIVKDHGGAITVESEPNQGTCFKVLLPAAEPAPTDGTVAPSP